MKKIIIYSHIIPLEEAVKTVNGDVYDSKLELYEDDKLLFTTNKVNVDSSKRYQYKVEVANGEYAGIVGLHRGEYPAIFLFRKEYWDKITSYEDFNKFLQARFLPSIYENPNWGLKKVVLGVNIHKGGWGWDWSAGCITIYYTDYDKFISFFKMNEKLIVIKQ